MMDVYEALLDYYQRIADSFDDVDLAAHLSGTAQHSLSREDRLVEFLKSHLPPRCQIIRDARVFDSEDNVSRQIPLLVSGDLAIRFKYQETYFSSVEACYCSIYTSHMLDRHALAEALEILASVPMTPEVPPGLGYLFGMPESAPNLPIRVIFAFDGCDAEELLAYLEDFYATTKVHESFRPDLIIVNNRYGVVRTGSEGAVTADGIEVPPHTFHVYGRAGEEPSIGGYSLVYLLTEIQKAVAAASQRRPDFGAYLDQLPS